ncbi:MAG: 4-alpha-glucanotransferase [Clostridia bacterium]|nr:4-alpha-glucanotransferase [Clostridia bacterium]
MAGSSKAARAPYSRRRGLLLPVFSLPSEYGVGTLGRAAHELIDEIADSGGSIWAVLPTGVTGYGDSPYQSFSSFAVNHYFLDLEYLIEEGLLTEQECASCDFGSDPAAVDYGRLYENRMPLLMTAYARAKQQEGFENAIASFEETAPWLNDYALFMAIKDHEGGRPWYEWPEPLKNREPAALEEIREAVSCEVGFHKFLQYKLSLQWAKLSAHAFERGVLIMGDMPIYCAYDSADCWAYRENFLLDEDGRPTEVAGVPPDYFCEDGQLWGNPVYDWPKMKKLGFSFWMARLRRAAELYGILRIDHFRGFASYYACPAGAKNARIGEWKKAEGRRLFEAAEKADLGLEIVAEDLGFITRDVKLLLTKTGFAGMQIMEFAFDAEPRNPHKNSRWGGDPRELRNKVAYTGTHDNPPLAAWWEEADEKTRAYARKYAGPGEMPAAILPALVRSDARYVLLPAQDILGLGAEARINSPGTASGNWVWRLTPEQTAPLYSGMKELFNL